MRRGLQLVALAPRQAHLLRKARLMENVVLTIHLILALLLIGIVLIQRSEGGGLAAGGGGAMTGRQSATAMTKLTWLLAIGFIITSITLTILAAAGSQGGSVVDQFGGTVRDTGDPVAPLDGDLLPPANPDAPLTPPRVDEGQAPESAPETVPETVPVPVPAPATAPAPTSAPAPASAPATGD